MSPKIAGKNGKLRSLADVLRPAFKRIKAKEKQNHRMAQVPRSPEKMRRHTIELLTKPGGVVEIRGLHVPTGRGKPCTVAGYFDDCDPAAEAAATLDTRGAVGVYFTLNEINSALLARSPNDLIDYPEATTSDNDILQRRWLPIDFDPVRPAGVSSSDDEHRAAEDQARACAEWLTSLGWSSPIMADSGNGAHLLYRIDLPNDDGGLVQRCLEAVAQKCDTDKVKVDCKVFNPARIWKLYGTTARKGFDTPDRPHRIARLVKVPDLVEVVPVELLEDLVTNSEKPVSSRLSTSGNGTPFTRQLNVPMWLKSNGVSFREKDRPDSKGRKVYLLDQCPFDSGHGGHGETAIYQFPDGKLAADCKHSSCTGHGWQQFKEAINPPSPDHYHRANGQTGAVIQSGANPADGSINFDPMTLAELMARDVTVEYLIDNLIAAQQPILLTGPVKSLKTSILLALCLALATGRHFLGYFRVLRSIAVAVLTGESGLATIKETLARIGRAAGIDPATVTRLIISDRIPHLASFEHLDAIRQLILDYQLELLAIDPAYLALDGTDAANVMIFGQQLRAVSELCQELGVALLLCHHTRKGSGVDHQPLSLTDVAWAGFAEHCRQWLLVNHRERYDHASGTHRLWLSAGGSAGHGGVWAMDVQQGHISDVGGRVVERDHSKCRTSPATGRRAKRSRKRGSTSRTART